MKLFQKLKNFVYSEFQSSLNRKGLYLFGATGISALSSFLFWMIAVRQTSPADVGIATGMLASVSLIKSISDLGFSSALIYYSGQEKINKIYLVNTVVGVNFVSSIFAVSIYLIGLPLWGAGLLVIKTFPIVMIFFVFCVTDALLGMQDVIMLSLNKPAYVFWRTIACNTPPFILLPLILRFSTTYEGIFTAYIIPNIVVFAVTSTFILPQNIDGYRIFGTINRDILQRTAKYGIVNQIGNIFWSLPGHTLPIIAVNTLLPSQAGYFAINWTIINFVLIIPRVMSTSQYIESSQNTTQRWTILFKTLRSILLALIPAIVVMWFLTPFIVSLFDPEYVNLNLPRIFLMGTIPFTLSTLYYIQLRVGYKLKQVIIFAALIGLTSIGFSSVLGARLGSEGIAYGWLLAYTLPGLFALFQLIRNLAGRKNSSSDQ